MKFYYKNQLIRTSKTHHYTHACIIEREGKKPIVCGCSASREGAEKVKAQRLNQIENSIDFLTKAIEADENGKSYFYAKDGRKDKKFTFAELRDGSFGSKWFTLDAMKERIKSEQDDYKYVSKNWIIVEVEEK